MWTASGSPNQVHIATVKRSVQYRVIRSRIARPCPSDLWYEDDLVFIVFDLLPDDTQASSSGSVEKFVVFTLVASLGQLIAARTVELSIVDQEMIAHDLFVQEQW